MTATCSPDIRLAAVVYGDGFNANQVLEEFARAVASDGRAVRGLVQRRAEEDRPCSGDVFLLDLGGRGDWCISQKLGNHSTCCAVDPGAVAEAGVVLRRALADGADLLVVNKFGKLEADGGGFVDEIATAIAEGVPVLTSVHEKHLVRWREFTGDLGVLLPADGRSLAHWWRAVGAPVAARS